MFWLILFILFIVFGLSFACIFNERPFNEYRYSGMISSLGTLYAIFGFIGSVISAVILFRQ